jgi:hypothetical protein
MKLALTLCVAAAVIVGLRSCNPAERHHTAEWERANNCMTEATFKLIEKGYSNGDAKVGATMTCSNQIDAVKGDGWEK